MTRRSHGVQEAQDRRYPGQSHASGGVPVLSPRSLSQDLEESPPLQRGETRGELRRGQAPPPSPRRQTRKPSRQGPWRSSLQGGEACRCVLHAQAAAASVATLADGPDSDYRGPAFDRSTGDEQHPADRRLAAAANDGRVTTRWAASTSSYPQSWTVDLGSPASVSEVAVAWYSGQPRLSLPDPGQRGRPGLRDRRRPQRQYRERDDEGRSSPQRRATSACTVLGVKASSGWASANEIVVSGTPQICQFPRRRRRPHPRPTPAPARRR